MDGATTGPASELAEPVDVTNRACQLVATARGVRFVRKLWVYQTSL